MEWRSWTFSEWNHVLLHHYFFASPDADREPIRQIVVTPEELARAVGQDEHLGSAARDAFVSAMRQSLLPSRLLLGTAARRVAEGWGGGDTTEVDPVV